ncbi:5'-3' DNA helicase ZGRF1 isoform X2 [Pelodiscus sinensis]|uniref:5'-3' DNA helicase ZGRF1 isoform X2 n=1 Tax=Pelodiscus sinensis TaxID=13735 RepID=UPI003F6B0A41
MACQEFTVLYTHQKTKKSKVWQDGVLKTTTGGNKATLFDDRGQCLESVFVKSQVKPGDDLESDRYLITIEAEKITENCGSDQPKKTEAPTLNRNSLKPSGFSLPHLPLGLKRKHTGFQGPRQIEKKMVLMEDDEAVVSHSSKRSLLSFPSQLYNTSPLFSTTCEKDAETNSSSLSNNDACTGSNRDHMSVSSLVSTSYIGIPKEVIHNRNHSISISGQMESNCQTVSGMSLSQNIRSKAQIIALLKSKPTQLCNDQNSSEITECCSGCQLSESRGILLKQKSGNVSAHMDISDRESTKNIQHQSTTEKTITNSWDVYMLPNSAKQSCDEEVTERRHDKKASNLGLDLQDPQNPKASHFMAAFVQPVEKGLKYNCEKQTDHDRQYSWDCKTASQASASRGSDWETQLLAINESSGKDQLNPCELPESNINKESDIQFVSSSEDVYTRSTNASIIFETNIPKCHEHTVTEHLKDSEVSSAQSQNGLLPRIDLGSIVNESRISGPEAVSEELVACGEISDPADQFMEINFNLSETFDFNDTQDEVECESNMLSQGSTCLTIGAMAQNSERRVHMNCGVIIRNNEERVVKYSTILRERDDNQTRKSLQLQLCDKSCECFDKTVKDDLTLSLVELGNSESKNIGEMNASTLNIEVTDDKKDQVFSPQSTVRDLLIENKKCSDAFVNGGVSNYECDTRNKFEKNEIISYIPATLQTCVTDKNPEKDVLHLGDTNSQDSPLEHYLMASGDEIIPVNPLLASPPKVGNSSDPCQYITGKHCTTFDTLDKEHTQVSRTITYPLTREHMSSKEDRMCEIEFENGSSIMPSIHDAMEGKRRGTDFLKHIPQIDNSSGLPDLVNGITLLRSLTEHTTALESLQMMEKNNGLLYQRETTKEKSETAEELEARQQLAEVSYSEDIQTSYLYFDSPESVQSSMNNDLEKSISAHWPGSTAKRIFDYQPKPVEFQGHQVQGSATSELMMRLPYSELGWNQYPDTIDHESLTDNYLMSPQLPSSSTVTGLIQSPGSRCLPEDGLNFITGDDFQKKSEFIEDPVTNPSSLKLNAMTSPSDFNLGHKEWTSWKPNKVFSTVQQHASLNSDSMSPTPRSEENIIDIQEQMSVTSRALPSDKENSACFFRTEDSCCSEDGDLLSLQSALRTRTPLITVPATGETPESEVYSCVMDCEEVQQSFGSPIANVYGQPAVFPVSDFGPEDRNYETSVECSEGKLIQPVVSNVTSQNRQSKWLKYQNTAQCDLITQNRGDVKVTDDFCAENVFGMPLADTRQSQSDAMNKSLPDSVHLQRIRGILGKHGRNFSSQDSVSEGKILSLHLKQIPIAEEAQKVLGQLTHHCVMGDSQDISFSELSFPSGDKVKCTNLPKRQTYIPTVFQSHVHYKQIFTAALTEHLNILLFEQSQRLNKALSNVNMTFCTSVKNGHKENNENCVPLCNHKHPAKLAMVKKEGQNKGRLFYTCDAPKTDQCKFFKWIEDVNPGQLKSRPSLMFHDIKSIGAYLRCQKISLYEECQLLVRRAFDVQRKHNKLKTLMIANATFDGDSKSKLYLKLSRKEHSSMYSRDDLWVVSKTLNFESLNTFIACSAFFGPSSSNEVELLPLKGYYSSNWCSNIIVHALLVCNASTELTALRNIKEYFSPATLPLIKYLLKMPVSVKHAHDRVNKRKFIPPALNTKCTMMCGLLSPEVTLGLARKMIQTFQLNTDQATALIQIAQMMASHENDAQMENQQTFPITIIHGVFGAGKSYLLSVVVLFLVQLFESSEEAEGSKPSPWKLLIASSTNVAVDRVLLGLLDLGFEDFIRVGSVRKIAKRVLPYSLHAGSGSESEELKELLALMKKDLTPAEKIYVRKSIEHHKLGTNKAILRQVKVVGATCAACPFPCMNNLKFPVVVLDECSQMTEPTSLLPIARFVCEKLVLVGDPKQLPPTIQGSEGAHDNGLEQTLFDRLSLMGHNAVSLRTQYRCHPAISSIVNDLFYEGNLLDGISEMDRSPLLDWLPTLCFFNVNGIEQIERDNSFYNMAEVYFIIKLIQSLIASGIEGSMIGVITLYKSQMYKIYNLLSAVHSDALEIKAVQVSTVDAFQGAEKEIIVLSCVRTRQVGFIDSEKRMNVALTRGKRHLLIVGNLACLNKNKLWGRVIHHCEGREYGVQHVSLYEQQLNNILKHYLEKKMEEENNMPKKEIKTLSQKEELRN